MDLLVTDSAVQVLLDDVALPLLDADEAIRDVDPITDSIGSFFEKVELSRVPEPCGYERGCGCGTFSLAYPRGNQRAKFRIGGEARRDHFLVACRDPSHKALRK